MRQMQIGVIGAGTMGAGIAQVCAQASLAVVLVDMSLEMAQRGVERIGAAMQRQVDRGTLSTQQRGEALNLISFGGDYAALTACDLVIEAASEDMAIKKTILARLDSLLPDTTLIASNTSSLSITELAANISAPDRFIGLHFFNPVPVLQLVEVIRGLHTSETTYQKIASLAAKLGKTPITVRNAPGFVVNRILVPMLNEAIFVLQEGIACAEDIDRGMMLGCAHPMGPLALADLVGLDTLLAILEAFHKAFGESKYRPAPLLREMVHAGRLGRKTNHGFHRYD